MIIQCEQCQTKFKLDDSKVSDKGIRVRCAKCRHVFSVARTQPAPEDSVSFWPDEIAVPSEAEQEFESQTPGAPLLHETPAQDLFSEAVEEAEREPLPSPELHHADDHVSSKDALWGDDPTETEEAPDEMDFGGFDFSEESGDGAGSGTALPAIDFGDSIDVKPTDTTEEEFGGLDFSGDDLFGEVAIPASEESPQAPISFDMGIDDFADSMGVESSDGGKGTSPSSHDLSTDAPFNLDDIDFGDELSSVAVQQVNTEELKPNQDVLFAPLAAPEALHEPDKASMPFIQTAESHEELPPLSIASRRKESSRISGMFMLLGTLIAGLAIFYGFYGYKMMTENKGAALPQEAGQITVRSVEAAFVKNKALGNLLVISGEAVNEFDTPRAAIQVKGVVFGADGKEVVSKTAFCGNPLSADQLATMSMEKIESTMANQFGDSLANMEVAAGGAIPFMIVIPQPPSGATDYGVEPAGSTVATAKTK